MLHVTRMLCTLLLVLPATANRAAADEAETRNMLSWETLPDLPDELGVAGPFAGVHNGALIVGGGANFPRPVWKNDKVWHDAIHVLTRNGDTYEWIDGGTLPRAIAYGAAVSTPHGVVCMGGNDAENTFADVWLLKWNSDTGKISTTELPSLPRPCAFGAAALVGDVVYLACGQSDQSLTSATNDLLSLDLSGEAIPFERQWQTLPPCPGPTRALNLTVHQHNGFDDCVYVISGRRQEKDDSQDVQFLKDVWEYNPSRQQWRQRADAPACVMAGTGIDVGQSHVFVFGGADGSLFFKGDELKDDHPGFPKTAWAYHTITNTWTPAGTTPRNHFTTIAVKWDDAIIIPSGELRPRVRTATVSRVKPVPAKRDFGVLNYTVLFFYLLAIVGVGLYFTKKNRNTEDYFRGGKQIPWWAAGCSIFATMLSSLTFTGLPSKSYAQDWVYAVGNFMIPVVAFIAVYIALPFFRRIDATSAYEYLERRFSTGVRRFGSVSFILFHIFRMAVVMSLTGLALSVATPLTPKESVLLMGILSIIYCTMGGIEAVIWTDTIQTVVLLGGGLLAAGILISGVDGGATGFLETASAGNKFAIANMHWDITSSRIALWVIIVGAIAQNTSSYTADQAVVQRYMTTSDQKLAARSIWTNAFLSIPATLLFFGIGTALYAWYASHPHRLDPTITTDQIFPLFIAREMPAGLAGLIVAGVFAAAQSTVSTSMNSTATAIVTDFLRPLNACQSEDGYLRAARLSTLLLGILGTVFGLVFVNPDIKSLFDAFLKVIGIFMGVLGGLFILGAMTRRATAVGAAVGAITGAGVMLCLWQFTSVNGYFYTASGIIACVTSGYVVSLTGAPADRDLSGLTIYTLNDTSPENSPESE